jgi:hypothetical protein
MTAGLPVVIDPALDVDLLSDTTLAAKTDTLFYLTKEAFKRRLIDDLWRARAATSPKSWGGSRMQDLSKLLFVPSRSWESNMSSARSWPS